MNPAAIDPLYAGAGHPPADATMQVFAGVELACLVTDTDPATAAAQWMADREVTLFLPDDIALEQLRAVLPAFLAYAHRCADRPTDAALLLPSRDVDRCRIARECGLWPGGALAVRDLRRPAGVAGPSTGATSLQVRAATPADAEVLATLWWEQAEYEAQVGVLRASPAIRAAIRARMPEVLAGDTIVLLAELDGEAVGGVVAQSPAGSAWVAGHVAAAPVSYLAMASTAAHRRGSGVGAALVAELHERHRAAGVSVSALHYSTPNPLSVPFWSQQGYRPLMSVFSAHVGG